MNRVSSKAEQTKETSKADRSNDELVSGDVNRGAVLPSDWTVPMSMKPRAGNLIVVTGPSGVGKGTVVSKLLQQIPNLTKSVSITTREMRPNETEGTDYFFRFAEEFEAMNITVCLWSGPNCRQSVWNAQCLGLQQAPQF